MRRFGSFQCVFVLVFFALACDGGGSAAPDGAVDGPEEDAGQDAGDDAGTRPDVDAGENFLLEIPEGAGMCSVFCEGRTWQEEYQMMSRVALKPGFYVLPRSSDPLHLDLVAGITYGPEQQAMQTAGAPTIEVREYFGAWYYVLRQDFLLDATPAQLGLWIWYEPSYWGAHWPAETRLEGEFGAVYSWASLVMGAGSNWCSDHLGFALCDLSAVPEMSSQGITAAGDEVSLRFAYAQACLMAGNTNCRDLSSASVDVDGQQRQIDDRVDLVYSAEHHNYAEKVLILLDPPLGTVTAVLVEVPDMGQSSGGALTKLDANLDPIDSQPFASWQSTYP